MAYRPRVRGAGLVEYLCVIGLVALAVTAAVVFFGRNVRGAALCEGEAVATLTSGRCGKGGDAVAMNATAKGLSTIAGGDRGMVCDKLGCRGSNCFAAGTPVATPDGPRPIESLAPGDLVLAARPEGGVAERRVVGTKRTDDREVLALELSSGGVKEVVLVTPEHPFFVVGDGWRGAGELSPDTVVAAAYGEARVLSVSTVVAKTTVFNIEVDDLHTYFVGQALALVHNDCGAATKRLVDESAAIDKALAQLRVDRLRESDAARQRQALSSSYRSSVPMGSGRTGYGTGMSGMGGYGGSLGGYGSYGGYGGYGGYGSYGSYGNGPYGGGLGTPGSYNLTTSAPATASLYNPHTLSDVTYEKTSKRLADWISQAATQLEAKDMGPEDRKVLASTLLDRLTKGDGPQKRGPGGDLLVSLDLKLEQRIATTMAGPTEAARRALVRYATTPEGAHLKRAVLAYVKTFEPKGTGTPAASKEAAERVIKQTLATELQATLTATLEKGLKDEKDAGNLKRLLQLIYVRDQASRNPDKWNPYLDREALSMGIRVLEQDAFVKRQLATIHADAERKARANATAKFIDHIAYMKSPAFDDFLALHSEEQQAEIIAERIAPIALIDREIAMDILARLAAKDLARNVDRMPVQDLEREIGDAFTKIIVDGKTKEPKYVADVSKRLAKAIAPLVKAGKPQDISKAVNAELSAMHLDPQTSARIQTAMRWMTYLDKNGHATSVSAAFGVWFLLADVSKGKAWKDRAATLESFGTIAKTVDSAEGVVKLANWSLRRTGELAGVERWAAAKAPDTAAKTVAAGKATPAAKWLLRAKLAGPAGDLLMAASAYSKIDKAVEQGNLNAAVVNTGKYGTALVAFGAGSYLAIAGIIGLETGPAAPIVWLVAAVGYIGFSLFDDTAEEVILKKLGVHKSQGKPKVISHDQVIDREIRKYANSCTSDRRNCPGPIGDRARELLDGNKSYYSDLSALLDPKNKKPSPISWGERRVIAEYGVKFYEEHKAPPGSCGNCHK